MLFAGANVIATWLGVQRKEHKARNEPWWMKRIKLKIKELRKDISRLQRVVSGDTSTSDIIHHLEKKYRMSRKSWKVLLKELKQRLLKLQI